MLTPIMAAMILAGLILILIGFFDRQHEATEAHMERRIHRITSTPLANPGADNDHVDRLFAKTEEQRNRDARKTTFLPTLSRFAEGDNFLGRLENQLIQVRSPWRASELLVGSLMLAMVVFVIFLLLSQPILSFVCSPIALVLPSVYLKILRASFFRKFDDQLADTLLLMSNSLRAGFSFMQAMEMVAREAPSPIKDEFARVTQEISLGVPIGEALTGMGERVNSNDLNLVIVAVIIQREIGGALAQLLELIAAVIRERQRIKGEIRTLTAQGRLTGGIMGCLPILVGFAINMVGKMGAPDEPMFVEPLFTTDIGHMMLAGALILQLIGFFLIMRIVDIKV